MIKTAKTQTKPLKPLSKRKYKELKQSLLENYNYIDLEDEYGEYILRVTPNEYTLVKIVTTKENNLTEKILGFYGVLETALRGYLKHKPRNTNLSELKDLINSIETIKTDLSDLKSLDKKLKLKTTK